MIPVRLALALFAAILCAGADTSSSQAEPEVSVASQAVGSMENSSTGALAEVASSAEGASLAELPEPPSNGNDTADPETPGLPGDEDGSAPWEHFLPIRPGGR
eukprot:TRINITY_DN17058_c0_g3_i1.p2 TRINITY_DN17058_c0_g3~~TRINITY_DN17058_c0_g3_i1.p2  ORF type:complete len:103 (-),score=19.23 TRINITY_DN17058_c0_g3_i1:146-454(-)